MAPRYTKRPERDLTQKDTPPHVLLAIHMWLSVEDWVKGTQAR